jgi:hypothetical protein
METTAPTVNEYIDILIRDFFDDVIADIPKFQNLDITDWSKIFENELKINMNYSIYQLGYLLRGFYEIMVRNGSLSGNNMFLIFLYYIEKNTIVNSLTDYDHLAMTITSIDSIYDVKLSMSALVSFLKHRHQMIIRV